MKCLHSFVKGLFFVVLQDRRDLVGAHPGLGQLGSTGSTSSFSSAPRLSHTPSSDFQPPYFPPPYNLPPQHPVDFNHHVNTDPYSHLANHYQNPHQPYQHLNTTERHHGMLGHREDPLQRGFGTYDTRRDYSGMRRPDVLVPSHHELQDTGLLSLHQQSALSAMDDGQVGQIRFFICKNK